MDFREGVGREMGGIRIVKRVGDRIRISCICLVASQKLQKTTKAIKDQPKC